MAPFRETWAVGDVDRDGRLDVDGNGRLDILVAAGGRHPQDELWLNEPRSSLRRVLFSDEVGDAEAAFVADFDGDGDSDYLVLNSGANGSSRLLVNLTRHLRSPDLGRIGLPCRLWMEGAPGGAVLLAANGPGSLRTPFGRLGLDPSTLLVAGAFGPPAQGTRIATELVVPRNPALLGVTAWWQAAVIRSGTLALTNVVADAITN